MYDPSQRRFISPDPLVSAPSNAQSYNRYSYVWNNPLNFTDPSGFEGKAPSPAPTTPPPGGGGDHTGGPGKDLKDGGNQGGGGPGGNVSGGTPATPYKASHVQGQSAGAASALAGNKWHPHTNEGRIREALFGSEPDPVPYFQTPTPLEATIAKAGLGFVPGLNSALVFDDPKSTTFDKAFAVTTDVLAVVGVGTVLKLGAKGAGLAKGLVVGAEVMADVAKAEVAADGVVQASKILLRSNPQLTAKYMKHAKDFGVMGNFSKANVAEFSRVLHLHINDASTKVIAGAYHGMSVTHYVNPVTGLNVIEAAGGNFLSGWKLNPVQLQHVLTHGGL